MSGLSRLSTVPAGSLPNAALVGANTVNGPGPCSVSTRPAALTAATSVVWSFEFTAFWTMFFDGYIGAPPTITVFSPFILSWANAGASAEVANSAPTMAAAREELGLGMCRLPIVLKRDRRGRRSACNGAVSALHGPRRCRWSYGAAEARFQGSRGPRPRSREGGL